MFNVPAESVAVENLWCRFDWKKLEGWRQCSG